MKVYNIRNRYDVVLPMFLMDTSTKNMTSANKMQRNIFHYTTNDCWLFFFSLCFSHSRRLRRNRLFWLIPLHLLFIRTSIFLWLHFLFFFSFLCDCCLFCTQKMCERATRDEHLVYLLYVVHEIWCMIFLEMRKSWPVPTIFVERIYI